MVRIRVLIVSIAFLVGCDSNKEITYYENGNIKFKVPLFKNKRHGTSTTFYKSGQVKLISNWIDGKKSGESILYFPNGKPKVESTYLNGKTMGKVLIYDSLGTLREDYWVKNDIKNGKFHEYFKDGPIKIAGSYINDKPHGKGFEYYEDGTLFRKYFYQEGNLVYLKGYTLQGVLYDSKLPINVTHVPDVNALDIKLLYTDLDSARIGVIIGNLNATNHLIDTLSIHSSRNLVHRHFLKEGEKEISGILYEIDVLENQIKGEYFFQYAHDDPLDITR